jgi:hypothetical protein
LDSSEAETHKRQYDWGPSDEVIENGLGPLQYRSDIAAVMLRMYQKHYHSLVFDTPTTRTDPRTNTPKRYYSHPLSGDWLQEAQRWAKQRYPGVPVRVLYAVLYSDGTSSDDGGHHPVYLSLANSHLHHFQSMAGKELVALLPRLSSSPDISKKQMARLRAALFQVCIGHVTQPFITAHEEGIVATNPVTNQREVIVPILAFWKGDHSEGQLVRLFQRINCQNSYLPS